MEAKRFSKICLRSIRRGPVCHFRLEHLKANFRKWFVLAYKWRFKQTIPPTKACMRFMCCAETKDRDEWQAKTSRERGKKERMKCSLYFGLEWRIFFCASISRINNNDFMIVLRRYRAVAQLSLFPLADAHYSNELHASRPPNAAAGVDIDLCSRFSYANLNACHCDVGRDWILVYG